MTNARTNNRGASWFAALTPGILVAATGVGAGDLMTASLAGSELGIAIAWAAAVGALLKWTVNEGLAWAVKNLGLRRMGFAQVLF